MQSFLHMFDSMYASLCVRLLTLPLAHATIVRLMKSFHLGLCMGLVNVGNCPSVRQSASRSDQNGRCQDLDPPTVERLKKELLNCHDTTPTHPT